PNHNDDHKVLTRNKDRGWYKWIDGASRYICSAKLSQDEAFRYWYQNEKAIRDRFRPQRTVRPDALTLRDLVNQYLAVRKAEVAADKIGAEHFATIAEVCGLLLKKIGPTRLAESLRPDDFAPVADALSKRAERQQRVRARIAKTLFKH